MIVESLILLEKNIVIIIRRKPINKNFYREYLNSKYNVYVMMISYFMTIDAYDHVMKCFFKKCER